jgi:hypothetical protein
MFGLICFIVCKKIVMEAKVKLLVYQKVIKKIATKLPPLQIYFRNVCSS